MVADGRYCFGSVDHLWGRESFLNLAAWLRYMRVHPGGNIDWWCEYGSEKQMLELMASGSHIRYHECKYLDVENSNPQAAEQAVNAGKENGWFLVDNNCIHQTYKVLKSYGATNIPSPFLTYSRLWFAEFPGVQVCLRKADRL